MTSEGDDPAAEATAAKAPKRSRIASPNQVEGRQAAADLRLCPFLVTERGTWRAAVPVREHLCAAVSPLVPLALEKQRRLCLTDTHRTCPAYLAGLGLRDRADGLTADETGRPREGSSPVRPGPHRPVPSTTPVLLERPRSTLPTGLSLPGTGRAGGPAILIVLLVIAFAAIALARFGSSSGAAQPTASASAPASLVVSPSLIVATPSPSPVATPSPSPSAVPPSPSPTVRPSASPTVRPTKAPPTPTPTPSVGTRTYTVKFGDTLSSIASRFGVTVASIQALNGIKDPSLIHPGQVLQIP